MAGAADPQVRPKQKPLASSVARTGPRMLTGDATTSKGVDCLETILAFRSIVLLMFLFE